MKTVSAFLFCTFITINAFAADNFELPASKGNINFPHKKHQEMLKDCIKCHEHGPGKIAGLDQKWAHKVCRGCHAEMNKGPQKCSECHQGVN
ncbi:MAG: cytochrome c3 family protein [Geobacteraceae bacterium]|nr:cytochrome c3 family protein [Geobacteraceae bacterium]